MAFVRSRASGFCLFVGAYGLLAVAAFSTQIDPLFSNPDLEHLLASVLFFDRFYLDVVLLMLVGIVFVNGSLVARIFTYLCLLLVTSCYLIQFFSVYVGGEFVTILAIDNVNHISLLLNSRNLLVVLSITIAYLLTVYVIERVLVSGVKLRRMISRVSLLFIAALLIDNNSLWASAAVTELRDSFYKDRSVRIAHKSPVESLFRTVFRRKYLDAVPFDQADADKAKKYGFRIQTDQRFPLAKSQIFSDPVPFQKRADATARPNVIIFFSEGVSARTVGAYGEPERGLTPNIDNFSRESMVVQNYFNHTFATYRGLQGQLCSIYPYHGGLGGWHTDYQSVKRVNYFCLSELFNGEGYDTLFLDTHRKDESYVDELMKEINFDTVINAEEVRDRYIFQEPLRKDALSDNQLFEGLVEILREREGATGAAPFLIGIYNLETHAWQKIARDGKPYSEERNYILDSIHNYDNAFGKFWQYFKESSYRNNTIVILTADHAHYPDRDFVKIAARDPKYRPYFVDRIPLIIHDPGKKLPGKINANYSTSIDFAPTVAHLMGFNSDNAFLGKSLFDSSIKNANVGVAAAGDEYFLTDSDGVWRDDDPDSDEDEMQFLRRLIHTIHQLERHDRIWPADARGQK